MSRTTVQFKSTRHGLYTGGMLKVDDLAAAYYGDVNASYRGLIHYIMEVAGFGPYEYWSDLSNIQACIVLAEIGGSVDGMRKFFVDFEDSIDTIEIRLTFTTEMVCDEMCEMIYGRCGSGHDSRIGR